MGQIINTKIDRFDGGLTEDKRSGWVSSGNNFATNKFSLTKHFDVFTYPHKLVPHYKTEADEIVSPATKDYKIVKFLFCPGRSGTYGDTLHGYGVDVGTTKPNVILYNDLGAWTFSGFTGTEGNATGTVSGRDTSVFFYYKSYIYLFSGSRYLCRYNSDGATAFNNSYFDYGGTTITSVAQPVHHPSDDVAYFFINNKVYSLNDTTWNGLVLTLPSQYKIVSACPFGNYLAIGCTTITTGNLNIQSVVFLWDRDSSLATLTERIDFGRED